MPFCNLHVDPADCLKFGFQWQEKLYVDVAIAFGWVHGTAASQLCSDAVAFIMAKQDIKLHCYIDDYIAIVPKARADVTFRRLRTLLQELGLPYPTYKMPDMFGHRGRY